jgi:hypothetical protein
MATEQASYPLSDDPLLADMARAMRDDGAWGQLVDADWNLVYVTDELRRTFGGGDPAEFRGGCTGSNPVRAAKNEPCIDGPNPIVSPGLTGPAIVQVIAIALPVRTGAETVTAPRISGTVNPVRREPRASGRARRLRPLGLRG